MDCFSDEWLSSIYSFQLTILPFKHFLYDLDVVYQGVLGCKPYLNEPGNFLGFFLQFIPSTLKNKMEWSDSNDYNKVLEYFSEQKKQADLEKDLAAKIKKTTKKTKIKV